METTGKDLSAIESEDGGGEVEKPGNETPKLVLLIIIFLLGLVIAIFYIAPYVSDERSTVTTVISETGDYEPGSEGGSSPWVVKLLTQTAPSVGTKTAAIATRNASVRSRTPTQKTYTYQKPSDERSTVTSETPAYKQGSESGSAPGVIKVSTQTAPRATTNASVRSRIPTTQTNTYHQPKLTDKKVVCTLGRNLKDYPKKPSDGLCDYILYDSLYLPGLGSLLEASTKGLQWFLHFARTDDTGSTQYGISFDYRFAETALDHLNQSKAARTTLRDMWDIGISHYALLTAPAIMIESPEMIRDTVDLMTWVGWYFRHWRGDRRVPIYCFLGMDLYKPLHVSEDIYDHIGILFNDVRPDALILRSHYTIPPSAPYCKITTTSSYNTTFNYFEASMVESLNYVLHEMPSFLTTSLLVSFTMKMLHFDVDSGSHAADYDFGKTCISAHDRDMLSLCKSNETFTSSYDQSLMTMRAGLPQKQKVIVYDSPETIIRKMCLIRKAYPQLHLGMALFDIDFEDTNKGCRDNTNLNYAAGFWRLERSSAYMKTVLTNVSFNTENESCP